MKSKDQVRISCLTDTWKDGMKDPDLTRGKFYTLLDNNVLVMGGESMFSFVGDSNVEVQRPKHIFKVYKHTEDLK